MSRRVELVRFGDVTIETVVQGRGPTLVIVPSLGRDAYGDYDVVAEELAAAGRTVLRPQPRGVGQSRGPMHGVDLHDFARDIASVIGALSAGPAILVGHAYGHFVCRMCATSHPSHVRGVVVAASAASDTSERYPHVWSSPGVAADSARPEAERLAALRLAFFAKGNDPRPWLDGWYDAVLEMQLANPISQEVWWRAGTAPLLEIIAEEDPFKPRDRWDELRRQLGERVTTVVIPGASHALFSEQPLLVAAAISAWVDRLP